MTKEQFIEEVSRRFGDRYDCSSVTEQGVKNNTNVMVRCCKHGQFWITPYQLLHGMVGCFECFKEKEWVDKKGEL